MSKGQQTSTTYRAANNSRRWIPSLPRKNWKLFGALQKWMALKAHHAFISRNSSKACYPFLQPKKKHTHTHTHTEGHLRAAEFLEWDQKLFARPLTAKLSSKLSSTLWSTANFVPRKREKERKHVCYSHKL